jgi:hypothetical protein
MHVFVQLRVHTAIISHKNANFCENALHIGPLSLNNVVIRIYDVASKSERLLSAMT